MDRVVAVEPDEPARVLIAQRRECGRIREPDHVVPIHHPDRLPRRTQDGGQEALCADV
jgi:hypothetical protein